MDRDNPEETDQQELPAQQEPQTKKHSDRSASIEKKAKTIARMLAKANSEFVMNLNGLIPPVVAQSIMLEMTRLMYKDLVVACSSDEDMEQIRQNMLEMALAAVPAEDLGEPN